jgi:hypothetical protein
MTFTTCTDFPDGFLKKYNKVLLFHINVWVINDHCKICPTVFNGHPLSPANTKSRQNPLNTFRHISRGKAEQMDNNPHYASVVSTSLNV